MPAPYIITVQALKEGWDCPYAYVFCSVANIQSSTDIEQLLGRVLRMPFAQRRQADDLNQSYAFVPEKSQFADTASKLVDKLVDMGFDEDEAVEIVQPTFNLNENPIDIQTIVPVKPQFTPAMLGDDGAESVQITTTENGEPAIKITGALTHDQQQTIAQNLAGDTKAKKHNKQVIAYVSKQHARQNSPAMQGKRFNGLPQLCLDYGDGMLTADAEIFLEAIQWNPLDHNHLVTFGIQTDSAKTYTIDIGIDKKIAISNMETQQTQMFTTDEQGRDNLCNTLTHWLEKRIRTHANGNLGQSIIVEYIGRNLDNLESNELTMAILWRCRHQLLESMKRNLTDTQKKSCENAMEQYLFAPDAKVISENVFEFGVHDYNPPQQYHSQYVFKKHYYSAIRNMNSEEVQVARILDSMEQVEYWICNQERGKGFNLPLATARFFPDFVAKLTDGRFLIVEHKGKDRVSNDDSKAKERIGKFWATKTGNVFVMTTLDNTSQPLQSQILNAL